MFHCSGAVCYPATLYAEAAENLAAAASLFCIGLSSVFLALVFYVQGKLNHMMQDKVIYTDGRDVVVTDSTLKVKSTSYRLNGITKLRLWTIRPDRWPGVLLLLIGLTAATLGFLNMLPGSWNVPSDNGYQDANTLAVWVGAALAFIGFLILALSKTRYAVRIGTAEGEKNAVVSTKREYIAQIVDAVNSAFNMGHSTDTIIATKE
jgi:hypothetical protein